MCISREASELISDFSFYSLTPKRRNMRLPILLETKASEARGVVSAETGPRGTSHNQVRTVDYRRHGVEFECSLSQENLVDFVPTADSKSWKGVKPLIWCLATIGVSREYVVMKCAQVACSYQHYSHLFLILLNEVLRFYKEYGIVIRDRTQISKSFRRRQGDRFQINATKEWLCLKCSIKRF